MRIFECVPNVSEGRDMAVIEACAAAIVATGVTLAHRTSDWAHHRSVFTYFGTENQVREAGFALARVAFQRINLHRHRGAHPRIGALDVLPFVPFGTATTNDAAFVARQTAQQLWEELKIPSFFYGAAATNGRELPDIRRGQFEGLARRGDPYDVGDAQHPTGGAVAVGVRPPLIAFNIVLASTDLSLARAIAGSVRERDGGLRTVRSLGIVQADGRVQVSCNLTSPAATPLWRVTALVRALAARAGVSVARCELIGLVPRRALEDVAHRALGGESLPHTAQS